MRGGAGIGPLAAEVALDREQRVEQIARRERRVSDDDRVQIERLVVEALAVGSLRLGFDDGRDSEDGRRERSGQASRSRRRSRPACRPRLLPIAIATGRWARDVYYSIHRVGQHSAAGAGAVGAAAEEVGPAGQRLLEEALVLERFAEDDVQHACGGGRSAAPSTRGRQLSTNACAPIAVLRR